MKNTTNKNGFTLVETIVAIAAFSVVVISIGTMYVNILDLQRRGFGAQKVQENALFMLELMAREIRVGNVNPPQDSPNCAITTLRIIHPVNGLIIYDFDSVNKKITRNYAGTTSDISSADVRVNRLRFCVKGSDLDKKQTRVTILMELQNKNAKAANTVVFNVQSTVTSRDITVEYQN